MKQQQDYYPIVLYPAIIQELLATETAFIPQPHVILPEIDRDLELPPNKILVKNKRTTLYLLLVFLVGVILAILGHMPPQIILFVGIIGVFLILIIKKKLNYEFYQPQIKEPRPLNIEEIEKGNPEHNTSCNSQDILDRKQKLSSALLSDVSLPDGLSSAQPGVSESFFLQYLNRYFGGAIRQGEELSVPGAKYKYSTDFSFIDAETGLRIDIEIDEPYEGRSKQPHHCRDDYRDTNRNKFFLSANWVVIRFSEEQISRYPDSCCRAIAAAISEITLCDRYLQSLRQYPVLQPQRRWDTAHATKLAEWNYRLKYLKESGIYIPRSNPSKQKPKRKKVSKRKKY